MCAAGDIGSVDPLLIEVVDDEITELVIRDLADETGFHAVMGDTDSDIGGRTADKFFKIMHILQRLEVLFHVIAVGGVKINAHSAQQDNIKLS